MVVELTMGGGDQLPISVAANRLKSAIESLHNAGTSDYFKTYLVLKAHGLSIDPPQSVFVDTTNTSPELALLFGVRELTNQGGYEDRPYYDPFMNSALKEHASRSVVQTHCKRFHDGSIPFKISWLISEQQPDSRWRLSFAPQYPQGLGSGREGLATHDDKQICIPTDDYVLWHFRYHRFDEAPAFETLFDKMKRELHFTDLEIALLFDTKRAFDVNPFESEPLDERELASFVAQEAGRGAAAIQTVARPKFSERKVQRMISTFRLVNTEGTDWWTAVDAESEALEILDRERVVLLVGPPGVGKTRTANRLAAKVAGGDDARIHYVHFHPSITYEDFVEALVPQPDGKGALKFVPESKVFLQICAAAEGAPQALILDEINRADTSRVFGEAMLLLERGYRGKQHAVARIYNPNQKFWIPDDLYVIATMNDIDRSTFDLDFALRRRFGEVVLRPTPKALESVLRENGCSDEDFIRIAQALLSQVQPTYPLGHAYFLGVKNRDDLTAAYRRRIRPAIEEFLGEYRKDQLAEIDKMFYEATSAKSFDEFIGV